MKLAQRLLVTTHSLPDEMHQFYLELLGHTKNVVCNSARIIGAQLSKRCLEIMCLLS
eukprot:XP_001706204.1 Hypothetical protein GL50803_39074 [Giardia lamblia ATCC 50803]